MDVIYTDEFGEWFEDLDEEAQEDVAVSVRLLEERGVTLGHPQSSALENTKYALRELRITSKRREIRVAYAFDPERNAVLLIGDFKAGKNNKRFYKEVIAAAENIWEQYLAEREAEDKAK